MSTALRSQLRVLMDSLADEDLERVHQFIQDLVAVPDPAPCDGAEAEIERRLLASGLMQRAPDLTRFVPRPDLPRLGVKGKPLSETIVEERR